MKNIFVGNLPYACTEQELIDMFSPHGTVDKASIIIDRETGRSKGFGFVEMSDDAQAQKAIEALNNFDLKGRKLAVNEARPREERPRSFSGGGGGGGRGGDRGGDRGSWGNKGGGGGRDRGGDSDW